MTDHVPKGSGWQYRIIQRESEDGNTIYRLMKVYVDGKRVRMYEKMVVAEGKDEVEIRQQLEKMIEICDRGPLYKMVGQDLEEI